jgi:predicted nucleic acid-binding protein
MSVLALLIDSDVLIDFLTVREPFAKAAGAILDSCKLKNTSGFMAAHSITNIFYLMRKNYTPAERKNLLRDLCGTLSIVEIGNELISNVLSNNDFDDIEDCLQAECAASVNADYIVTRNIKDYTHSKTPAILPEDFLKKVNKG